MPTLPVQQYSKIYPAEYNAVQAKVAAVMGPPVSGVSLINNSGVAATTDATFGYNQTLASSQVSQYQTITAKHLYDLRLDLLRARNHQLGVSNATYLANVASLPVTYVNTTATSSTAGNANVLLNATAAGSNLITLNTTSNVNSGAPIVFATNVGGLVANTVYYIDQPQGNGQFSLKTNAIGTPVSPVLTTASGLTVSTNVYSTLVVGTTVGMTVGGGLQISGTTFGSLVSGNTYYIVLIIDGSTIAISDNSSLTPVRTLTTGTGSMAVLGTGTYASRYKKIQQVDFDAFSQVADAAVTDRLTYDSAQILPDVFNKQRNGSTSPWGGYNQPQSLTQTITVDFGTANAARAFFNSGSFVALYSTMSNPDASLNLPNSSSKNVTWNTMFDNLKELRIQRSSVTRTGTGSGVTLAASLGWINLTTSHQEIARITPPLGYANNVYTATAKLLGTLASPTGLEIIIKYYDNSNYYAFYSTTSDYVGGPKENPSTGVGDPGGGTSSSGPLKVDEPITGTLTSNYYVYRAQGTNTVSIPLPTVSSSELIEGDNLPTFTCTASATSINEGQTVRFTVNSSNFAGTTLYYTIDTGAASVGTGYPGTSDFSDGLISGTITLTSGSGFVDKTLTSDTLSDGLEVIYFRVRTVSTSGLIVANAPAVAVFDTSKTQPPTPPAIPPTTPQPPSPTPPAAQGKVSASLQYGGLVVLGSATSAGLTTNQRQTFAVVIDSTMQSDVFGVSLTLSGNTDPGGRGAVDGNYLGVSYPGYVDGSQLNYTRGGTNIFRFAMTAPNNGGNSSQAGAYKGISVQVTLSSGNGLTSWTSPSLTIPNWYVGNNPVNTPAWISITMNV